MSLFIQHSCTFWDTSTLVATFSGLIGEICLMHETFTQIKVLSVGYSWFFGCMDIPWSARVLYEILHYKFSVIPFGANRKVQNLPKNLVRAEDQIYEVFLIKFKTLYLYVEIFCMSLLWTDGIPEFLGPPVLHILTIAWKEQVQLKHSKKDSLKEDIKWSWNSLKWNTAVVLWHVKMSVIWCPIMSLENHTWKNREPLWALSHPWDIIIFHWIFHHKDPITLLY